MDSSNACLSKYVYFQHIHSAKKVPKDNFLKLCLGTVLIIIQSIFYTEHKCESKTEYPLSDVHTINTHRLSCMAAHIQLTIVKSLFYKNCKKGHSVHSNVDDHAYQAHMCIQ